MDQNKNIPAPEDLVSFTYPEGFQQIMDQLVFLPPEQRAGFMAGFLFMVTCFG